MSNPRRKLAALITALLCATAPVLVASPASALSPTFSLHYLALGNGHSVVARWNPCRTHTYKVNLAAAPAAARRTLLAETKAAVQQMDLRTGMSFTYNGPTTEVPVAGSYARQSADLIIAYTTPAKTGYLGGAADARGGNIASVTTRTVGTTRTYSAAIIKGFVVVDTAKLLRLYKPGFGTGPRRGNLLEHELGHVVGLGHVNNPHLLMNPVLTSATPNGYAAGDLAGLARVGRKAGCITGM
jgi:hypothetical protein